MNMDWTLLLNILSWVLFIVGGAAVVIGALGIVRFPDFYTRLHAAGVTDTAGAELIILGMAKLAFIAAFLGLTSPVATHAIAHAAWMVGFKPLEGANLQHGEGEE